MIQGKMIIGMGGALDLVHGEKNIVIMDHVSKDGSPKIKKECSLPLTGKGVVNKIIKERALTEVAARKLEVREVFEGYTIQDVIQSTEATLFVEKLIGWKEIFSIDQRWKYISL
ncbi:3-oxoacid CoA-transferase subunit B [Psychrobacillus sp. OK032]|nr:3-oxoacid CoA-transferase subunit B [Psychrobacillus sp. OK032]